MKLCLIIFLTISAMLLILSCSGPPQSPPKVSDPPQSPQSQGQRIVSLSPAITEILFELGLGRQIIGTSEYSDYPPAARQIPRVGGYGEPNIEQILRLSPDLVISQRISPQKIKLMQTTISPACPLLVLKLDTLAEIIDSVQKIAQATQTTERGQQLVLPWQKQIQDLQDRYGHLAQEDRLRVYVEVSSKPLRTCGPGNYLSEIISLVGGRNLGDATRSLWPVVASETVVVWNPQVILITGMKRTGDFKKQISSRLGWENIEAVKTGRIIELSDAYQRQGPRLFTELENLAQLIRPDSKPE